MIERSLEVLGCWLVIAVFGSWLSAAAYPAFNRYIRYFSPSLRALVRFAYAGSAPVAALLAVVLVTQPAIASFLIPAHCHGVQCGAHTPVYVEGSVTLIVLASVACLIVLTILAALLWALRRGYRRLRILSAFAHSSGKGYRTLDSAEVLVCCVGLWRPQILVSRGLLEQLAPDELAIVLAHEQAHAERYDNMRALLLRWLTVFWPLGLAQSVRSDSRADAEQACDLAAAQAAVGTVGVVSVIRKLAGLSSGTTKVAGYRSVGFDCDDATTRIGAFENRGCGDASSGGWGKAFICLSLTWCIQVCLLTAVCHLLIESLAAIVA